VLGATANLVNCIVGAGIIGLPAAVKRYGALVSSNLL
jgi:amino acid permease